MEKYGSIFPATFQVRNTKSKNIEAPPKGLEVG